MSVVPALMVVVGLALIVAVVVAATSRLWTNLPRVASFISRATIVVSVIWLVLLGLTVFSGGAVQVTAPITPMPPVLAKGVELDGLRATIVSGGFDRVAVTATGLSMTTRVVTLIAGAVAVATLIGVCLVVDRLARSLGEGDPFALGGDALRRLAWIVSIGGVLASVLGDVGDWMASHDLFGVKGWSASADVEMISDVTRFGWPEPVQFVLTIPFWPLGAGLVLALLAGVFRYGRQLRRDAAGLV